jgi:hypothetical protein
MRIDGKLKSWNDERGYGFIDPVQVGKRSSSTSRPSLPGLVDRPSVKP